MTIRVPFLPEADIERDADELLDDFVRSRSVDLKPPIPIEDIVEKHLKLHFEFDDLHRRLGVPAAGRERDIFGAIWFERREIVIDESLDPEEFPSKEGRYRFTLGHEAGGHWRLHRDQFLGDPDQGSLFSMSQPPAVICRSSQAKVPAEWQADTYSSFLLMPRKLLLQSWQQHFEDLQPFVFDQERTSSLNSGLEAGDLVDRSFREVAQPFARQFNVSVQAMVIRLEKLGLLLRHEPLQRSMANV